MIVRRLVTALMATGALAGCGSDTGPTDGSCVVTATSPAFDETDVSVAAEVSITWNKPVDLASVASEVHLKRLGGPGVPYDLEATSPNTVTLRPKESLWFWGEYALTVGGVTAADGGACSGKDVAFTTVEPEVLTRALRPSGIEGIAKVGGYLIASSSTYRGLQVYDVEKPAETKLVAELSTDEGPASLSVLGDRAYAAAGNRGVLIFDVSAPTDPRLLGRAGTPGYALAVAPFERDGKVILAVADYSEGVRLLDVSDAAGPKDLGTIDPSGTNDSHVWGVDIQGTVLAIAEGVDAVGVLSLFDISDLQAPVLMSQVFDDYDLYDVKLAGAIAYASRGPRGVRAWNVSTPTAPVLATTLLGPTNSDADRIQRIVVDGTELFAATGTIGVERVTLDGSGAMALAAFHDVPGRAWSVAVDDRYIYAGAEAGLVIFERGAPSGVAATWFDPGGHGLAREVVVADDLAYVAAGSRGLQTFAVTDPSSSSLIDQDDTPGMNLDVAAGTIIQHSDLILLGDMRAGVVLYDRSSAEDPVPIGFIESADTVQGMQVVDSTLFACDGNQGMFIADIASPAEPMVLARQMFPPDLLGCSDIEVVGDVALLGTQGGLAIVNVSEPSTPSWLGWSQLSEYGSIQYMRRVGDHLLTTFRIDDYEGTYNVSHKLLVFDISDPLEPRLVWHSDNLGSHMGEIAVVGDIGFVAGGDQGVFVFHLADVTAPQLEGVIPTQGNAHGLAVSGNTLHIAQAHGGLVASLVGDLPGPN